MFNGFSSQSSSGRSNDFPDLDSIFSSHGFSEPQPQKGNDIRQEFFISFQEAALGTQRKIIIELNGNKVETSFKVPAGSKDGSSLRLTGKGQPGINSGPYGDLYLKIRVNNHPHFKREGDSIVVEKEISPTEALLGINVVVSTLTDSKNITIPPCTESHTKIKLKGLGIPFNGGKNNGDQLVRIIVKYPKSLTDEQLGLVHQLKITGL